MAWSDEIINAGKKKKKNESFSEQVINGSYTYSAKVNNTKELQDIAPVKKEEDKGFWDSVGYTVKSFGTGILGGLSGMFEAGTTEVASNLKKGEEQKDNKLGVLEELFNASQYILNPTKALTDTAINSAKTGIEVIKDKDKNGLQKLVELATNATSNSLNMIPGVASFRSGTKALGTILPEGSSETVMEASNKVTDPYYDIQERLYQEGQQYGGGTQLAGDVAQVVGRMAPSIATTLLTKNPQAGLAVMGTSVKGSSTTEALKKGADLNEAVKIGDTKAMIEIGTEMLFGGVNVFGKGAIDDIVEKGINRKVKNEVLNYLSKKGIGIGGEVIEETISDILGNTIDKGTVDPNAKYTLEDWGDTAVTTILSTMVINALTGGYGKSSYRANVQEMQQQQAIDKEVQNRINKQEAQGITLTNKERAAIEKQVTEEYTTQQEKAPVNEAQIQGLQQEIQNKEQELAQTQDVREQQIIQEEINNLQEELNEAINAQQITDESQLRKQNFTYQAQETDSDIKKAVYESASKVMNNTEKAHKFVDAVAKIADEKGTIYKFTNNEQLKELGYSKDNVTVNGLVNENGEVLINIDSAKALNTVVGHETTHLLEGTKEYKALKQTAIEYAKTKGDYDTKMAQLHSLYKDTNTNIENELVSDIVGDYLFTDENFIKELSVKQPTVFEKIKNFISDLVVKFKGTEQEKQLRKLQRSFEKAYKAQGTQTNTDTKYSVSDSNKKYEAVYGENGKEYQRKILRAFKDQDGNEFRLYELPNNHNELSIKEKGQNGSKTIRASRNEILKEIQKYWKGQGTFTDIDINKSDVKYSLTDNQGRTLTKEQQEYFKDSKARDENGNLITMYHGTRADFNTFDMKRAGQNYDGGWSAFGKGFYFTPNIEVAKDFSEAAIEGNKTNIKETYLDIKNPFYTEENYSDKLSQLKEKYNIDNTTLNKGYRLIDFLNQNGYDSTKVLQELGYDGVIDKYGDTIEEVVVFNSKQIKNVDNTNPTSNPDIRYSLSEDNEGNILTKEQQEKYKYSKIRDENGSLKVMYHGTQRADRVGTLFDPNKATSGPMAFFTDSQDIAQNYSTNKSDTSLSREYDTEYDLFKVDGKDLDTYWNSLSKAEQQKINKEGNNVGFDDNWENIVYGQNASENSFSDMYNWYLNNQEKGNGIKALYDVWVQDGNIMGDDLYKFQEVLEKAGIKNVDFLDPYKVDSKVYEVYLNITNPFDTSNMSEDIINQFKEASKTATIGEQYSADMWDKSNIAPEDWISKLENDIAEGTTHAWTVIPDWVTNVLKANGYDGIVDTGGKNGGAKHQVVIPFYSEQIKDVNNQNPTTNPDIRYSLSEDTELSDEAKKQLHRYINMDTKELNKAFSEAVDNKENMLVEYNALQKEYKEFQNTEEFKNALNDFVSSETPKQETTELMDKANKYADKLRYYNEQYEKYKSQQEAINSLLMGNETDTRSVKQIVKEAEKHFGITNDFKETAYIDINGNQIDFSGKHEGGMSGSRSLDHRQINEIDVDMQSFIDMGNIRIIPEGNGINLSIEPNAKQYAKLEKYINNVNGEIYIDIDKTNTTYDSAEYKAGTPSNKIISDIQYYFKNGSFPKQSDFAQFRYSLSAKNDIAPTKNPNLTYGEDVKLQVEEAIAPLQETINNLTEQVQSIQENIAPVQEVEQTVQQPTVTTKPTQAELDNLMNIKNNKSGSEYASAFFELRDKYGQTNLYKALNEYYKTGTVTEPSNVDNIDLAPTSQEIVEQQGQEAAKNITDNDAPSFEDLSDIDFETGETTGNKVQSPLDSRDIDEVGNRKVKAYQYENPEIRPFFQTEAQNMLGDLENTIKGERIVTQEYNPATGLYENGGYTGTTRQTTEAIAYLKDNYGYSYDQIRKGLNDIIEDNGAENNAVSKRIEFMLDERLREGYTTSDGYPIPPNEEYINFLNEKQITEYNKEAFNALTDADIPAANDVLTDLNTRVDEAINEYRQRNTVPEAQELTTEPQTLQVEESIAPVENVTQNRNTEDIEYKQRKWVETSTESEVVNREILPDDLDQTQIFYQPITNKGTLDKANVKLDTLGYSKAVEYFNNQILNKKTTVEDIALGERLIQEAIRQKDTKTAGELIQNVAILGTELGQKVQALSIIQRMTPEGQLKMLEKTINRGKVKGDAAFTDIELTQDMKDKILKTYNEDGSYNQDELTKAVEDVKQEIADQMPATVMDKINAWRYLSMLGNPKTHIRNIVSNIAMKGTTKVKDALARTIEDIAPIRNKTKTWKQSTQEVQDFAKQTAVEMKDIISGDNKYSEEADIKSKRDIFKNKVINKLANFNSDMLEKEDWFFSKGAFESSFSEFLTANGINTQQDIQNNPELIEKAKIYATEQAQIATFRQYSWLANKIREIENKNVATNIAVGSVLPFKKTPINIAKTGLNYSPLGFAKTLTYDIAQVKKGNMEASTLVDHIAQNTVGSALTLVGYMLAQAGFLNGGGDDDKEGKYDYQLGKQAYSINIGGNTYSLSWLSPVAMPLFVGANAYSQLVEGEEWNADVVLETLGQTLDPLSEMSFLSSLDSVLSSYDNGVQRFFGIGEAMLQSYASQFIPTISSQTAATLDDTKRTTKVSGDSGMKVIEEVYNKLIYKIPFLRETLEPSTDIWGNEVKQSENTLKRAFENYISPYARKESIATDIDEELKDLFSQTGDNGVIPNIPYNYVNYDGEKYNMSAKEYTDYKKTYGQTANDLLEDLFKTTTYQNATSEDRADMVNDVFDYASDTAKRNYLDKEGIEYTNATKDGVEYYKTNDIKGAIENDMAVDEYRLYQEKPDKYNFFKENGISYRDYDSNKDLYNYAYEHQDDYKMSKAITDDFATYYSYMQDINDLNAKDESGNSVSGLKKARVIEYVNSLDLNIPQKAMMIRRKYSSFDSYNNDIVEYLVNLDMSYEDKVEILKGLDMTVDKDGNVSWK